MVKSISVFNKGYNAMTEIDGAFSGMLMDIGVYFEEEGHEAVFFDGEKETAFMILTGCVEVVYNGETRKMSRATVFAQNPSCLHVPKNTEVLLRFNKQSEVLIQKTINENTFPAVFYGQEDVAYSILGEGVWENTAKRVLRTVFDYNNAPYSNMVLGEVVNLPGRWSSYIPHHHPQPEVYYYKFDNPDGFGCSFIGDNTYKITHNSFAAINGGYTHPQVTAPGYSMYYCWMIRHLENNPWTTRVDDPRHTWLLEEGR